MLTPRLRKMYEDCRSGAARRFRKGALPNGEILRETAALPPMAAAARAFRLCAESETPVIIPDDRFYFTRTRSGKPPALRPGFPVENLTPDWDLLLRTGLRARLEIARRNLAAGEGDAAYLQATVEMLEAAVALAGRYAAAAERAGDAEGAALLRKVPMEPAETLREALQSIWFMFSMFHLSGVTLLGFGRMDQYLARFYDPAKRGEAFELFAEFFIRLNRDNDLYGMVQVGDDGQSLMLGGCDRAGNSAYNDLTRLLLEVSFEVSMINPKINLRVSAETPDDVLALGVRLTGRGLGFPQYCNDEVVIPALCRFGYPLADARDYTVAACWEFVVGDGRDIPNCMAVNLALAADRAIRSALREHLSFPELLARLKPEIRAQLPKFPMPFVPLPNPLFSAFCGRCLEQGRDLHDGGGTHYHLGCHGCGSSTGADSLAAVKKWVYDLREIAPETLLDALEKNFEGYDDLREKLQHQSPKTGDNTGETNGYLKKLFNDFADVLGEVKVAWRLGGRVRPGTGSAQLYVDVTRREGNLRLHATADGRRDGEYISSSLSPAPGVRAPGVLSILQTYGGLDYTRLCNGGPITMEFDSVYFRDPEAVEKTVEFIRAFVRSGCQQLQMNTLDRATLLDAQEHPERHRDLIVRVWGWSGYFVELDKLYQDQIVGRTAYRG